MEMTLDRHQIKNTVTRIVEGWAGAPLNETQRRAIDSFMQREVEPLDPGEIMSRMGTSADTLQWFLSYLQSHLVARACEPLPGEAEDIVCYAA